MRTVIVGIGNPLLADDGVGISVAREVRRLLPGVKVVEANLSGIPLLEELVGYDRAIIVDSIKGRDKNLGRMRKLRLEELGRGVPSGSHGIGLGTAIALGRRLGYELPKLIEVYAIEVVENDRFHLGCSPQIQAKVPELATRIAEDLRLN
jgi:hydrogenase maturation protease